VRLFLLASFESEAQKWDAENDMVVLAKEMCMMVMDMSDFTRYHQQTTGGAALGHLHCIIIIAHLPASKHRCIHCMDQAQYSAGIGVFL